MSTQSILIHSSTNYLTVGKIATDSSIILDCFLRRGALYAHGTITIAVPFTDFVDSGPTWDYTGDDCGVVFTADINGADVRLIGTVDATSTDDISFDWNKQAVKGSLKTAQ